MSKSAVDFIASFAGDFTQSLALERNLTHPSDTQWVVGLHSIPWTGQGDNVPAGYSLGGLRRTHIIPGASGAPGTPFWRRALFAGREKRQYCTGFGGGARSIPVPLTGSPLVRYFFRVRGVCEMVGWGEDELLISTTEPQPLMGNIYTLNSANFRLRKQDYRARFRLWGADDTVFTFAPGLVLNRTLEPSPPAEITGTFYIDRIVSVCGVPNGGEMSASLGIVKCLQLSGEGYVFYSFKDPESGDYLTVNGGIFGGTNGLGPLYSIFANSNSTMLTWGNNAAFNPPSLTPGLNRNLMPEDGFGIADAGAPGGVRKIPVPLTNALEVVFMGARAENSLGDEQTIDISPPREVTEF